MSDTANYLQGARLDGRGYVLLGAGGGGIGPATARAFSGAGASLLCVDISEAEARTTAASIGGEGIAADIRKRSDMARVFARADELFGDRFAGVIDIVAVGVLSPIEACDDETLDWQFGIVFRHALLALQHAAPLLAKAGGGSITLPWRHPPARPFVAVDSSPRPVSSFPVTAPASSAA